MHVITFYVTSNDFMDSQKLRSRGYRISTADLNWLLGIQFRGALKTKTTELQIEAAARKT